MATLRLAGWAKALQFSDLPDDVVRAAVRSFYNWAGCAIGGSTHQATAIAHRSLRPLFGAPTSSLLGHKGALKADAQHAALINGIASHVHDYDDTHLDTIIHPTGPVASALLAVAEWKKGVSGKDLIVALVAGIEAECKVGLAVWPEHYDVGWHITSTTGSIGAAVAVSKILGLSVSETAHAIGMAATQVVGLREMFGSHTKSFHPGRAAQCGLIAAVMAQGGYTSSEQALEAKRGWANVVGATKPDVQQSLETFVGGAGGKTDNALGLVHSAGVGRWEILRNSYKPFPCGIVIHPIIDACAQLHHVLAQKGLDVRNVTSISVEVHPLVLELTGKRTPKDGLEAKFSVFHSGACGLLFGKATPAEYEDAVVQSAPVIAVRDLIQAQTNTSLAPDQAKVTLVVDGQTLEKYVDHAVGSLEVPMDDTMLEKKFVDQCVNVVDDVQAVSQAFWNIASLDDVSAVTNFK
ncbi:mmge/prpd family protein [Niveomyces insectorum RCEF 264]|uniref:Mmge/prpd family protein n=1 Tax=Niveomyces insectorum RCEF 264 TaxID=1081102 RepID=A0A167YTZ0_9HYPO|nr:mmge/prpd family protein [Niveomyces insectorum RCEF 264]